MLLPVIVPGWPGGPGDRRAVKAYDPGDRAFAISVSGRQEPYKRHDPMVSQRLPLQQKWTMG